LLREAVRGSRAAAGGEEGERAPPAVRIGAFLLLNELLSTVPSDSKSGAVEISSEFVVWLGPASRAAGVIVVGIEPRSCCAWLLGRAWCVSRFMVAKKRGRKGVAALPRWFSCEELC